MLVSAIGPQRHVSLLSCWHLVLNGPILTKRIVIKVTRKTAGFWRVSKEIHLPLLWAIFCSDTGTQANKYDLSENFCAVLPLIVHIHHREWNEKIVFSLAFIMFLQNFKVMLTGEWLVRVVVGNYFLHDNRSVTAQQESNDCIWYFEAWVTKYEKCSSATGR